MRAMEDVKQASRRHSQMRGFRIPNDVDAALRRLADENYNGSMTTALVVILRNALNVPYVRAQRKGKADKLSPEQAT